MVFYQDNKAILFKAFDRLSGHLAPLDQFPCSVYAVCLGKFYWEQLCVCYPTDPFNTGGIKDALFTTLNCNANTSPIQLRPWESSRCRFKCLRKNSRSKLICTFVFVSVLLISVYILSIRSGIHLAPFSALLRCKRYFRLISGNYGLWKRAYTSAFKNNHTSKFPRLFRP